MKDEKHDEKKEQVVGSTTKLDDIQKLLNNQIKELNALASRSKTENQLRAEFDEIKREFSQMVTDVQHKLKIDELSNSNNDKLQQFEGEVLKGDLQYQLTTQKTHFEELAQQQMRKIEQKFKKNLAFQYKVS